MENIDLRTLDIASREVLRKRGIAMIKQGIKQGSVALFLGVNKNTISNWCHSYQSEGIKGLKEKVRGVKSADVSKLNPQQEHLIQKLIVDKMPDQYKLDFALWTRKAVKELVAQELGIELGLTTMGDYLRKWGFSPQKPKKRAYEQNPKAVQKWLLETYPSIKERAKEEDAEIHWGDETGVRNACHHGRSYAPKGQTPIKKSMAKRFSVNMISSITNQGKVQFMLYSGTMNADRLIMFLEQIIKNSKKKIFLILDNLKVHHSKIVKEWLLEHQKHIEVFFLPSYSPEINPDEYLNCDLKQGMSAKKSPRDAEKLQRNIEEHMEILTNSPSRVAKYFKHKSISYAA